MNSDLDVERRLEPERKLISVLFADVKGSTRRILDLDAEDALAILSPVIRAMAHSVHRFGGVVSREAGDGLMAFFGAPTSTDDHAERACLAALHIHEEVGRLGDPNIGIRIGIHSGTVVLHHVQHDFSDVYDAAGAVVHVAQKLEAAAAPGATLISGSCLALLNQRFEVSAKRVSLPILDSPIEAFELKGQRSISRWEARAASGLSKFVGRNQELRFLDEIGDAVDNGASRLVLVEGEPGAGKSRFVHSFFSQQRFRQWQVWRWNVESTTKNVAWHVSRGVLWAATGLGPGDDPALLRARLAQLGQIEEPLELLALDSLVRLSVDNASWGETAPERRIRLMCAVFARVLSGVIASAASPTALLIEDLQWIDEESLRALNEFVGAVAQRPVLIVVTSRPVQAPPRFAEGALRLRLSPLTAVEAAELVGELLGDDPGINRLKEKIVQDTGGIPLFVEEVVRHLVGSGVLVGAPSQMRANSAVHEIGIPPTVEGVIASRIDLLTVGARSCLQVASILDSGATVDDFVVISERPRAEVSAALDELQHAAFLRVTGQPDGREVRFVHELIREVAYATMLRARRRAHHRRALDFFAARQGGGYHAAASLYRHAAGAEDWVNAIGYARRAATEANEQSAYWNSIEHVDAAIEALSHVPESDDNAQLEIDLRLQAREAFGATAQLTKLVAFAESAERRAEVLKDSRRMLAAATQKAGALIFIGSADEALSAAENALARATASGVPAVETVARYVLGQAYFIAGRYRQAAALMAETFDRLPPDAAFERFGTTATTSVLLRGVVEATSLASMGEFTAAQSCVAVATDIADQTRRPYDIASVAYGAGYTALLQGFIEQAAERVAPALNLVTAQDIVLLRPILGNLLGQACVAMGRGQDGLRILESAVRLATELRHVVARLGISLSLGVARMATGDLSGAELLVSSCLEDARRQGYRGIHSNAARQLAMIRAAQGQHLTVVEELLQEAITVARSIEARPSETLARFAWARCLLRTKRREEAKSLLASVEAQFVEMDMSNFGQQATKLLETL